MKKYEKPVMSHFFAESKDIITLSYVERQGTEDDILKVYMSDFLGGTKPGMQSGMID